MTVPEPPSAVGRNETPLRHPALEALPWWRTAVVYQIYPKSFQDTTGDGKGDLRGIIRRLDHLTRLGVDAVWLTPVYLSPQHDNGYDIADYRAIDPAYGTMADFEELVEALHERGIRLIMDMVLNHTSTDHAWFQASLDPESPYRNYYYWRDPAPGGGPPNNWQSKFGGSAWRWHAPSGQYYLHLFAPEQADLNWENPAVREEAKDIVRFWAARGVDGVRLDVVNLISKEPGLPETPGTDGREHYTDGPRVHEFLRELNRDVLTPHGLMSVGEMSSTSLPHCLRYAALDGEELSMTFNFHHLKVDYGGGDKWSVVPPDLIELKRIFDHWQRGMQGRAWNALFWSNHDQPRVVTRFGGIGELRRPAAKMLALTLHGLQGTPYIYQGEELGMPNPGYASIDDYRDVESLNAYAALIASGRPAKDVLEALAARSRDNGRTPMRWDSSPHGGFSTTTPWLAPGTGGPEANAEAGYARSDSVFHLYRHLIDLRRTYPVLTFGDYTDLLPHDPALWCYRRRSVEGELLVVANMTDTEKVWQPPTPANGRHPGSGGWAVLASSYKDPPASPRPGLLRPFEGVMWHRCLGLGAVPTR